MTDNDLIKRDDVIAILQKRIDVCDKRAKEGKADLATAVFARTLTVVRDAILDLAAVDAVQVEQGEWILENEDDVWELWKCSVCGKGIFDHRYDFCPYCGADMRGEQDG